ncbi:hypothetical protein Sste5344_001886 [Sporothrix stenoceras]
MPATSATAVFTAVSRRLTNMTEAPPSPSEDALAAALPGVPPDSGYGNKSTACRECCSSRAMSSRLLRASDETKTSFSANSL